MNTTGQTANDNFEIASIQLDVAVSEEEYVLKSNPEKYSGVYKEIAELLGDAATVKIWRRFSGLSVIFPQKLYSKEFREEYIREKMDEKKPSEIARELGLSERRIRQIIMEIRQKK